jgi:hypothetical protein
MRHVALSLLLAACTTWTPVVEPPAPAPVAIDASPDVVARAVREELAIQRVPFNSADTSTRVIASYSYPMRYGPDVPTVDCGAGAVGTGYAIYRVELRREGAQTLVAPVLTFTRQNDLGDDRPFDTDRARCASLRAWERDFAAAVKARAEGRPITSAAVADSVARPFVTARDGRSTYYANSPACGDLAKLPAGPRRYFATEEEARRAGYRRSLTKGC